MFKITDRKVSKFEVKLVIVNNRLMGFPLLAAESNLSLILNALKGIKQIIFFLNTIK